MNNPSKTITPQVEERPKTNIGSKTKEVWKNPEHRKKLTEGRRAVATKWLSNSPMYKCWENMKERCNNPKKEGYDNYGGRGIKCLWTSFLEFRNDMFDSYSAHIKEFGEKQTTLERVDVDGHYCKENCKWATVREQNLNRRDTYKIPLLEVSKVFGIPKETFRHRIISWGLEKALEKAIEQAVLKDREKQREEMVKKIKKIRDGRIKGEAQFIRNIQNIETADKIINLLTK